ncbi:MAG TPA: TldD/PmbA family protein [Longimicrobiaceae bacterium]|nr:TldD/PmbA family protein [Longimicrobiaceae bacterium]
MAETRFFSRDEAEAIASKVLGFSRADEARVNINSTVTGNTRFAQNQVSTSGDTRNGTVAVTSAWGRRVASATTNRFDDESLRQVVETSERLARLVPEDPEYLGELGPHQYPESRGFFESTAGLVPEERARAVLSITRPAQQRGLVSTGFLTFSAGSQTVATRRGLFAYNQSSRVNFTTTVRTPDGTGSGWAGTGQSDWSRVRPEELAERAIRKAELSRNPQAVEPGEWTVVLEPTAVANLVQLMVTAMNARNADEGRSFFSKPGGGNRIGEKFLDSRVTLWSDPSDPDLASPPFNNQGLPNRRVVWVENGVLRNLQYDRFWAQQKGVQPTGGGGTSAFYMRGGDSSVEDMIASTERGLLVTRFWYIRAVDPRTILYTGLTRDGTFLIENGRIVSAVKNLRYNESPVFMLNNIEMIGEPVAVSASESGDVSQSVVVPALRVRDFTFSSISDAV